MDNTTKNVTKKLCFEVRLERDINQAEFDLNSDIFVFSIKLNNEEIGKMNGKIQGNALYVYNLYINEHERKKGYATDLIVFAEQYFKNDTHGKQVVNYIVFHCNKEMKKNVISIITNLEAKYLIPSIYIMEV